MSFNKSILINSFSVRYIFLLISVFINIYVLSQPNKRTNNWFFSDSISIDFNSGEPVIGYPGPIDTIAWGSTSIMSDTVGNLLFYSDGFYVYNKNHEKMQNSWAGPDYVHGAQSALCMPKPGSVNLFYVFTANIFQLPDNQPLNFYHTLDMSLNNGLGGIVKTDTLPFAWDASEQLGASYFKDKSGYWIIMRKYREHKYAAWKVTSQGVDPDPILSDAPNRYFTSGSANTGYMKISYDKKYIIYIYTFGNSYYADIEICKFNNDTGIIEFLYSFKLKDLYSET